MRGAAAKTKYAVEDLIEAVCQSCTQNPCSGAGKHARAQALYDAKLLCMFFPVCVCMCACVRTRMQAEQQRATDEVKGKKAEAAERQLANTLQELEVRGGFGVRKHARC